MVLLVNLQDGLSGLALFIEKDVLSLPCSLKRNMALLGSNHARDRAAARSAIEKGGSALFYCGLLPNAKKNPLMKRSRFLRLMPL